MAQAFVVAMVLVAIAEIGDKTQMLSLLLASRYPPRRVFVGVLAAVVVLQALATVAGGLVGSVVPGGLLAALTALLFIGFGVWTLRDAGRTDDVDRPAVTGRGAVATVLAVAAAFFLAELGDKTQVLTFAVAADPAVVARTLSGLGLGSVSPPSGTGAYVGVWLGSSAGMMLVNGVAIAAGAALGSRVSRRSIGRVSGVGFIVFGIGTAIAYILG